MPEMSVGRFEPEVRLWSMNDTRRSFALRLGGPRSPDSRSFFLVRTAPLWYPCVPAGVPIKVRFREGTPPSTAF